VTFAAFIYLPASFAAAIFGMNVQEINETGRGITTFVVTAVVLLITTLLGWALSVRVARYRKDRWGEMQRYRNYWRNLRNYWRNLKHAVLYFFLIRVRFAFKTAASWAW
jgi:predicted histidine transporter YuiF (NhaC family)